MKMLDTPPAIVTKPARIPWIVSIQYDAPTHHRHHWHTATGVLIAPRAVLTCAHSFSQDTQRPGTIPIIDKMFTARVGGTGVDDGAPHEITAIHTHPRFDAATGAHDLAIAILAKDSCAAPLPLDPIPAKVGDSVIVLGWPRGEDGPGLTRVRTIVIHPRIGGRLDMLCLANLSAPDGMGVGYSGGPVIRLNESGGPRLRGIVHAGAHDIVIDEAGPPALVVNLANEDAFIQEVLSGGGF